MTPKVHKLRTKRKRLIEFINLNKQRGDINLIASVTGCSRYLVDKTIANKVPTGKKSDAIIAAFIALIKNREQELDKQLKSIQHEN